MVEVYTDMALGIFDEKICRLGEGSIWMESRQSFAWLDILSQQLFEKPLIGPLATYKLNVTATAILPSTDVTASCVRLVAENGIYAMGLQSGDLSLLHSFTLPDTHRTNDAGIDPSGRIVFGVMECQPTGLRGWIERIEHDGTLTRLVGGVGIPNTISWSTSGHKMYYADSFRQTMYVTEYPQLAISEFFSLKDGMATPDGSCVHGEFLYTAEWDGWRVAKRCISTGKLVAELAVPVPRPTSCVIHDERILITTASDGLAVEALDLAPDSGKTFIATIEDFVSIK